MSGSRKLGTDKDVEKLARKARKAGWVVEVTGGNHIRWIDPQGRQKWTSSLTPSNRAGVRHIRRLLEQEGVL